MSKSKHLDSPRKPAGDLVDQAWARARARSLGGPFMTASNDSGDRYQLLFMNMAEEIHVWQLVRDDSGRIKTWRLVDANPPALKTWSRQTLEEIRGKTTDEILGPGATEHYMPVVQKIFAERAAHSFEEHFPHLDRYFRFTSVPLGDCFLTTCSDITAIKQAEAAKRRDAARTQRVADRLNVALDASERADHDKR